jgi:hypothetical protein
MLKSGAKLDKSFGEREEEEEKRKRGEGGIYSLGTRFLGTPGSLPGPKITCLVLNGQMREQDRSTPRVRITFTATLNLPNRERNPRFAIVPTVA